MGAMTDADFARGRKIQNEIRDLSESFASLQSGGQDVKKWAKQCGAEGAWDAFKAAVEEAIIQKRAVLMAEFEAL